MAVEVGRTANVEFMGKPSGDLLGSRNVEPISTKATAALDSDAAVQLVQNEHFSDCTIFTIAHRMYQLCPHPNSGVVAEFDRAFVLLESQPDAPWLPRPERTRPIDQFDEALILSCHISDILLSHQFSLAKFVL